MPLTVGKKLGSYEILSPLGAGGMGEVYRARDNKLGREVAIKVLPDEFAHPQKLACFEREARLLAALNHPNIATLYGVEEFQTKPFLVMELVEGETLAERIARGPLPVDEAMTLSQQIAEALEAAHEKGVIHRDLKPANIKVTPEGRVKILDFGLAKALAGEAASLDSQSPTATRHTKVGAILGTASYMSPEQARGKSVDERTDIWAFGCVLYEALTGRVAFRGDTASDIIAAILDREPDWRALPESTPPSVRVVLRRCMQKDANRRLHDIADARIEIEEALSEPDTAVASEAAQPRKQMLPWALMGIVSVAFLVALWRPWQSEIPTEPSVRLSVNLGAGDSQLYIGRGGMVALSPDGGMLAFVARTPDGNTQLYIRSLDNLEATPLSGTEGAFFFPFFSPDGQWLAFLTRSALKKVSVNGGAAVTIAPVPDARGSTWGPDDTIVYTPEPSAGLYRVPASGGMPVELTTLREGEESHRWPSFLPNGKAVLFVVEAQGESSWGEATIEAVLLETGERKVLHRGGTYPRYASSSHLLYAREATLFAMPFDADRIEPTGEPSPVIEGVGVNATNGLGSFAVADDGTLVYIPGGPEAERRLVWVDREGREEAVEADPLPYDIPRVSPDGSRVAVEQPDNLDIHVFDLERHTLTRLTFDPGSDATPLWTPDGQAVVFRSSRGGGGLFKKAADGTGEVERLTTNPNTQVPSSWSRDGNTLVFYETTSMGSSSNDIFTLSLEGEQPSEPLLHSPFLEEHPAVSPDGRWIAYTSRESGEDEIYVRPFPNVEDGRWQVSTSGGTEPVWGPDGRELFYATESPTAGASAIMVVPVTVNPTFRPGNPDILFEGNYLFPGVGRHYDIAPDGQRFLMLKASGGSEDTAAPESITLVQNWFEELKRLVPSQ